MHRKKASVGSVGASKPGFHEAERREGEVEPRKRNTRGPTRSPGTERDAGRRKAAKGEANEAQIIPVVREVWLHDALSLFFGVRDEKLVRKGSPPRRKLTTVGHRSGKARGDAVNVAALHRRSLSGWWQHRKVFSSNSH